MASETARFALTAGLIGLVLSACGGSTAQTETAATGGTASATGGRAPGVGGVSATAKAAGGHTGTATGSTTLRASGGTTASSEPKPTGGAAPGGTSAGSHAPGTGGSSAGAGGTTTSGSPANGGHATAGSSATATGGKGLGGQSTGGAASSTSCGQAVQVTKSARTAKSTGFTGSYEDDYYPLYSASCTSNADCKTACVNAGGTADSCGGSECIDSTPDYCLPPTYWFGLDQLRIEGSSIESSVWIIMVSNPYRDQLIASDFQFEIPQGATIQGIAIAMNRSADSTDMVGDFEVKLVRDGATVGLDRALTTAWPMTFTYANYGGASDLWGSTWTAADLNASSFGVALTPMYLDTAGNARGYVDFVRATVSYAVPCN